MFHTKAKLVKMSIHVTISANVVAFGNPCHVHRPIIERDKKYYYHDRCVDEMEGMVMQTEIFDE